MKLRDIIGNRTEIEGDIRPSYYEDEIYIRVGDDIIQIEVPDDTEECDTDDEHN